MTGARILVVEDHPASRSYVRMLLSSEGYQVEAVADAEAALALLASFEPQLVLTDIALPGMSGLELAGRLREDPATRHVVILAVTAHAGKEDAERARAAGCDGHVVKPFRLHTLLAVVAEALAGVAGRPPE
jgi:two-component system cell cycle response regulator DivK